MYFGENENRSLDYVLTVAKVYSRYGGFSEATQNEGSVSWRKHMYSRSFKHHLHRISHNWTHRAQQTLESLEAKNKEEVERVLKYLTLQYLP